MFFSCLQRLLRGVLHWYAFCSTAIYYEVLLKRNTYCSEGGQRGNLVHCTCCLFTERETHKDCRQVLVVGSQFKLILYERSHNHQTTITLLTLWKVNILKLKWKLSKSLVYPQPKHSSLSFFERETDLASFPQTTEPKIPSEMEVAPRYNCWNCWHCWHS